MNLQHVDQQCMTPQCNHHQPNGCAYRVAAVCKLTAGYLAELFHSIASALLPQLQQPTSSVGLLQQAALPGQQLLRRCQQPETYPLLTE
jgi:hypothetical protein